MRVMGGGALLVVRANVWAPAAVPYPANPRESALKVLRIQDPESLALPPPNPIDDAPAALGFRAPSADHVARSQNSSAAMLVGLNSYINEIRDDGVLVPVMLVPIVMHHDDGDRDVAVLAAVDGSSRLASSHQLLNVRTSDVTYAYAQNPRRLNGVIGEITKAVERIHNGIEGEVPAVRALIVPSYIIVGCRDIDLRRAIQGFLGMAHVSHPTPWGTAGEVEAKADAALIEMRDAGVPAATIAWFAGEILPDEHFADGGSPELDRRAVDIIASVRSRKKAAATGIRRVDRTVQRVWPTKLSEVCADLALRPVRTILGRRGREMDIARQSLQEIIEKSFNRSWTASGRDPEELRDLALTELAAGKHPGPGGIELVLLASYWLTSTNVLRPLYYSQRLADEQPDRRGVHQIVYGMLETQRGIHQLYRVVRDSRDGIAPRSVDAAGSAISEPHSQRPLALSNDVLRIQVVPHISESDAGERAQSPSGETPETQLLSAQINIGRQVRSLRAAVDTLAAIKVDKMPAAEVYGWPIAAVEEISEDLNAVQKKLHHWQSVAEVNRERQGAEAESSWNEE
jgi:hypothetical protein